MKENNKVYILQNRRGMNFLCWIWLSTNLFVTIKFHDLERSMARLPSTGGTIDLLAEEYLFYKPFRISRSNIHIQGADFKQTLLKAEGFATFL